VPSRMGLFGLILTPNNALALAKGGWSKQAVKDYIVKNTLIPEDYYSRLGYKFSSTSDPSGFMGPGTVGQVFHPTKERPEPVKVFVFGGFGSWMGFLQGGPPAVTKKVELPKKWAQLVKKYQNVVPTYARY
jgi:hypothetical protein